MATTTTSGVLQKVGSSVDRYEGHRLTRYSLRKHQDKLCEALHTAPDVALQSLTVSLYSQGVIDKLAKAEVLRHPGYMGANMLMDIIDLYLDRDPEIGAKVLDIMNNQDYLCDIIQKIRDTLQVPPPMHNDEVSLSKVPSKSHKTEEEVVENAWALNSQFETLLDKLLGFLKHIPVDRIKLKLSMLLIKKVEELSKEMEEILDKIDEKTCHGGVLGYLVRKKLLGYLNHQLLQDLFVFIVDKQWNFMLEQYKAARNDFLKSTDLKTLAQVFHNHSSLAPKVPLGIPAFTVHLSSSWDGLNFYCWNELLEKQVNWPRFIYIEEIKDNCIIIKYGVLPFFAPAVVRDLTDPQIVSILEEHGVTKLDLSDQLKQITGLQYQHYDSKTLKSVDDGPIISDHFSPIQQKYNPLKDCEENIQQQALLKKEAQIEKDISLLQAVQQGADISTILQLLKEGANIHTTDHSGDTPLHHAAISGNKEMMELLLNKGAVKDIDTKNLYDETPLYHAVQYGHDSIVELLIVYYGAAADDKYESGYSVLHCAANYGCNSVIEILIQHGATIDKKDEFGETPLHYAAKSGKKTTVELVLKHKADYSIQSESGDTILHSAAKGGNTEIVKLFLKHCDLHQVNDNGYTPLHCAVEEDHIEAVKLLLKSGGNVDGLKGCHSVAPLHVTAKWNLLYVAELLLKAGASVHSKDKSGLTPLHYAAEVGHTRMVELLLKHGANINEKDQNGFTPLHLTAGAKTGNDAQLSSPYSSLEATVTVLLSNGANINELDNVGHSPMYYADKQQDCLNIIILDPDFMS